MKPPGEMSGAELLNELMRIRFLSATSMVWGIDNQANKSMNELRAEILARLNAGGAPDADGWLEFGPNTPPWNAMYRVRISSKDKTTAEWNDGRWLWDACDGAPITDLTSQVTHYKPEAGASRSEVSKPPCHVCGEPMKVKTWSCACGATTWCSEAQPLQASALVEAWKTLQNQIAGILAGHPVRCFDETMSAMDSAVKFFFAPPAMPAPTQPQERFGKLRETASPQLEQTLRVGMAAGQICRILNVQDRQGWHWDRFVEILMQCFPVTEEPQLEQVALDKQFKYLADVYQEHSSIKLAHAEAALRALASDLQRHFPCGRGESSKKRCLGTECHVFYPAEKAASPPVAAADQPKPYHCGVCGVLAEPCEHFSGLGQTAPAADGRREIQVLVDALVELGTLCSLAEVEKNNCASCRILHERIPWLRELVAAAPAPVSGEGAK